MSDILPANDPPETLFIVTDQRADGPLELLRIKADGTIVRGPGFSTVDHMSLKFWEAVERYRRRAPPQT
jgi:hypothetical protein